MSDLIDRQDAIDAILAVTGNSSVRELYEHVQEHGLSEMWSGGVNAAIDIIIALPSAQPDNRLSKIADLVEGTIDHFDLDDAMDFLYQIKDVLDGSDELPSAQPEPHYDEWCDDCKEYDKERHCCPRWNKVIRETLKDAQPNTDHIYAELSKVYNVKGLPDEAIGIIGDLMLSLDGPSAQPERTEKRTETHACDCISRQAAIDAMYKILHDYFWANDEELDAAIATLNDLPSAQPERTCVNCGRTVNNGGWYADGGTRCPIEEHYALPKDGFCHLWEKRNVTDDDYPERRTDEQT